MSNNVEPPDQGCKVPPEGWYCSRSPGHEGPCAARPLPSRGTGPEDFEKLLDEFDLAVRRDTDYLSYSYDHARDAIRGYVSRLQSTLKLADSIINNTDPQAQSLIWDEMVRKYVALRPLSDTGDSK